jgi:hypothetical protein
MLLTVEFGDILPQPTQCPILIHLRNLNQIKYFETIRVAFLK